ncbi:MAG: ATP-binding cassette domain-containing protein [Conexibacteraceae bacterium]|nr:ATP-binding cassette domain-containing protein [Conexibacteraceae bacterium]
MIEVNGLTKHYGDRVAVEDLTFQIQPGIVTGFLGPNGAGKSTTMRLILDLDNPTRGHAIVNGKRYRDHAAPLHEVGALLEARAVHTGRTGYNHLLALAQTHGIPRRRVNEVIDIVGLESVANKRVGGFSLGMGQRLGVAAALLGDPATVILDEPANGLDPEGIRWIRNLLKSLAAEGRTVFLSSHLMSEMEQTAERLIVIGKGRLIADTDVASFVADASSGAPVRVRSPQPAEMAEALRAGGGRTEPDEGGALKVFGLTTEQVGEIAAAQRLVLHELTPIQVSLEDAFMSITRDSVEYQHHDQPAVEAEAAVGAEV